MPVRAVHHVENPLNEIEREMSLEDIRHAVDEDPSWLAPAKRLLEASLPEPWGKLDEVALSGRPCFLMPGPYAPEPEVAAALNFLRNLGASLPR